MVIKLQSIKEKFKLKCYSDYDFEGDKENINYLIVLIIYINDNIFSWSSKKHTVVETISTQSEYISLSEMCKEIIYIKSVVEFLYVSLTLPIEIFVDNRGDIVLEENPIVNRTKHVDTRYHLIHEYVKYGTLIIKYIKSE